MSILHRHADEIFDAARTQGDLEDCRVSILVGRDGNIRMLPGSGWELEALRLHHGASAVYRVTRERGQVRLEARSDAERCVLETAPHGRSTGWRPDFPQYRLENSSFAAAIR